MTLVRFLLVRLVTGVLGLLVFASAIWLFSVWLVPGDFTSNFTGISGEERDAIRAALGLDRPLLEQYFSFIGGLIRLDLGESLGFFLLATGLRRAAETPPLSTRS